MDAVLDPKVQEVVCMTGTQVGKTSCLNNVAAYFIVVEPSPIMFIMPTITLAENYSTTRLQVLIRDTPVLREVLPVGKVEGDTKCEKAFPGGHMSLVGANSPVMLSSQPIRVLLMDEVDRFPMEAGGEGDPMLLAEKRTATFPDRKIVKTSTPTVKGQSRIEQSYLNSDQRRFYVPCPDCGEYQLLEWKYVVWDDDPRQAHYVCPHCGLVIEDKDKPAMLAKGEWRATKPFTGSAGFHLNELYSPWRTFGEIAQSFIVAKDKPEQLKVFTNTTLAETWEESTEGIEKDSISNRGEVWVKEVPANVLAITIGVDVQAYSFVVEVVGWGESEESWSLAFKEIVGDPSKLSGWDVLTDYIFRDWTQEKNNRFIRADAIAIDTGGLYTEVAYEYARKYRGSRVVAVKGSAVAGKPIISKPQRVGAFGTRLVTIGTDTAKDAILENLRVKVPGIGYCHFPVGREDEYFAQLTSEKVIRKLSRGYSRRLYIKKRSRNEALDCRVYAYAALLMLKPDWVTLARRRAGDISVIVDIPDEPEEVVEVVSEPEPVRKFRVNPRPRGGFVGGWRK